MRTSHFTRPAVLVLLAALAAGPARADDKPTRDGFKPMFDLPKFWIHGGSRDAWGFTGDERIICLGGGGGWLMHPKEFADVEFRFEYKMARGSNSGVTIRCPMPAGDRHPDPCFDSYEIQLVDDENTQDGKKAITCTGSIYGVVAAKKQGASKPLGQWNDMHIVARGTKVTATLNGETVQDADLKDHADKVKGKHPNFLNTKGYVGLQSNVGKVEFRNLKIKELGKE